MAVAQWVRGAEREGVGEGEVLGEEEMEGEVDAVAVTDRLAVAEGEEVTLAGVTLVESVYREGTPVGVDMPTPTPLPPGDPVGALGVKLGVTVPLPPTPPELTLGEGESVRDTLGQPLVEGVRVDAPAPPPTSSTSTPPMRSARGCARGRGGEGG